MPTLSSLKLEHADGGAEEEVFAKEDKEVFSGEVCGPSLDSAAAWRASAASFRILRRRPPRHPRFLFFFGLSKPVKRGWDEQ
jgi:hypothetical protein